MFMTRRLKIMPGPRLADRTSLGLGGRAIAELVVGDPLALDGLPGVLEKLGGAPVALGAGSNIIAADEDLPLVLVRLEKREEVRVLHAEGEVLFLRVDGALPLPAALSDLAVLGASGLEGLAGIPGSVGGAVAMNAGSFGAAMGDVLEDVTIFSFAKGLLELSRGSLDLGYRHLRVKGESGGFLVTGATLRLRRDAPERIRAAMKRRLAAKRASQPVTARSAGCVYKNPSPDMPAGRLLDEAGFKGRRLGGMAFSDLHANFLINEGGGSFAAAGELMAEAERAVRERYGLSLEKEVVVWA
jgi:UDP-N-acetylmuramate dehydrogenase